ncbi:cytochrome c oxidase assembly factor 3 homolog, mitochondrial [Kryptolebias marmoratus]|uniref:Cytochrome c oxidase assembly factor 3 n=1 Tax=Kryptolebias marmoratus TaxID=37003 RepID=A0A3Q3B3N6_KRYMA|nr:cytochrome c oxidase assembly factor 3 homolog, mitochondrial [Kryptolebias marmoratus]
MAENGAEKESLRATQKQLLRRQQDLRYFQENAARLRSRNLLTGACFGAFVLGIFGYTIMSVKQERVVEELDEEAKIHIVRGPRTGANS